jgi:hypothetical protein
MRRVCWRCEKSNRLRVADVLNWREFAARVVGQVDRAEPSPGARIWALLSEPARKRLIAIADGAEADAWELAATDLDQIVLPEVTFYAANCWPTEDPCAEPWSGVFHREDWELLEQLRESGGVDALRQQKRATWQETVRVLNRRLLQVGYPDLLTRLGCGRLYFGLGRDRSDHCPVCKTGANWSQRTTQVWVKGEASRQGRNSGRYEPRHNNWEGLGDESAATE